jgi:uncharacterized protein
MAALLGFSFGAEGALREWGFHGRCSSGDGGSQVRHHSPMDRSIALQLLKDHGPALVERFGVVRLALFGSTARGTAGADSDVDVLVAFDGPATSERYFGVQFYLEDLLGCEIDLVSERAFRPQFRPYVERDAIPIV